QGRVGWRTCSVMYLLVSSPSFFSEATATTATSTLSLHDALPICHGLAIGSQLAGDGAFRVTLNRRQDNAAAQRHLLGCSVGTQPLPNLLLLAGIHHQYRKFSRHAQA